MSFLPPSDYTLTKLLGENATSSVWLAEQMSVRRNVVLEQLRDKQSSHREAFIADVRAKGSIDHPLIASIYEAINDNEYCFFAREWLPGHNLATMMGNGITLIPAQMAHILKRIAEANMHLEERGTATGVLTASHIYLNEQNVLRLSNLAQSGVRSENASDIDMEELGGTLLPLMTLGAPGYTRVQTLLYWMTGSDPEHNMRWSEIRHYADQIEQQLATPVQPMQAITHPKLTVLKKKPPVAVIIGSIAAIMLIAMITLLVINAKRNRVDQSKPAVLDVPINIPEGNYPSPDGGTHNIREFWMSAHEVTIGEYREFLDSLKVLDDEQRKIYDHESQPAKKINHEPDDWSEIILAADKKQVWRDRLLSVNSPAFGVDWWDAHAYCEWKRARLPSQEEWYAAMCLNTANPLSLKPAGWNVVQSLDKNGAGFLGMAGGVSEWTRKPASDPSNPLGARLWVIIGASFAKTANGAQAREWINNRDLRRHDLGFRIAYDHLPD